jgi:hypothetical protein
MIIEELNYPICFTTVLRSHNEDFINYCLSREKPAKHIIINNIGDCYNNSAILTLIENYEDIDYKEIIYNICDYYSYQPENIKIDLLKFIKFIYKKIKFHNFATEYIRIACHTGDQNLLDFFIKKGFNNWSSGLIGALNTDNSCFIRQMLQRGASVQLLELYQVKTKNQKILKYIINQNILKFFTLLTDIYDKKFIINIFNALSNVDKNVLIRLMVQNGRFNIFKLLTKRYDFKENLEEKAIESGHIYLIKLYKKD